MDVAEALAEVVRLGLQGNPDSVRRFARSLVRSRLKTEGPDDSLARVVSELLNQQAVRGSMVRRAEPLSSRVVVQPSQPSVSKYLVLDTAVASDLDRLVAERENRELLKSRGLEPSRAVLFTGPPGVGKTMAANAVAERLSIPIVSIDLADMMSSHLGKSGRNLKESISTAKETPCVLFIDEFDSVAKKRDDPSDVGELKRIVNLLLLELDRWDGEGLLLAATNHPELLDRAIWRRFDRVIKFELPSESTRLALLQSECSKYEGALPGEVAQALSKLTNGESGSSLATMVRNAARDALLTGRDLAPALLEVALGPRDSTSKDETSRRAFAEVASRELGWTHRRIGAHLGLSHVAVGNILRQSPKAKGRRA